jgi:hypothetical protein
LGQTGKGVYFEGNAMNTCKCWTVVLIAVLLLPNVAASADAAKKAYEKGKACFAKRDYDAAIAAFSEAIRLDPKDADAYLERAMAYMEKGEQEKTEEDIVQAMRCRYTQQRNWLPEGATGPVLSPANSLPPSPGSENPFYIYNPQLPGVPGVEVPKLPYPFFLLPNERSVPQPPMQGPQLIPDKPMPTK